MSLRTCGLEIFDLISLTGFELDMSQERYKILLVWFNVRNFSNFIAGQPPEGFRYD
jgi:hypothetical protein